MQAGRLDKRITIQQRTESTQDDFGAPTYSWATFKKVWAWVRPLSGTERFIAEQVQSTVTHLVRIRFLEGVTSDMRIMLGTRTLNIDSVLNLEEANREMELMCGEEAT